MLLVWKMFIQYLPTPKRAWVAQKQVHLAIIAIQVYYKLQQHTAAFLSKQEIMVAASDNQLADPTTSMSLWKQQYCSLS